MVACLSCDSLVGPCTSLPVVLSGEGTHLGVGANLRPSSNALIWELVSLWLDRLSTGEVMATTKDGLEVDEVVGCSLVVCSGDDAARVMFPSLLLLLLLLV